MLLWELYVEAIDALVADLSAGEERVLLVVAAGLAIYGVFSLVEGWCHRLPRPDDAPGLCTPSTRV
jgi:hypothetical protein